MHARRFLRACILRPTGGAATATAPSAALALSAALLRCAGPGAFDAVRHFAHAPRGHRGGGAAHGSAASRGHATSVVDEDGDDGDAFDGDAMPPPPVARGAPRGSHTAAPAGTPADADGGHAPTRAPAAAAAIEEVKVSGPRGEPVTDVPPITTFAEMMPKMPRWLQDGVKGLGFTAPTTIQSHAMAMLLAKRSMVGLAPTGSGKTFAFAIPSLATMRTPDGSTQILVVCPVRELVQQTAKVFRLLTQHNAGISVAEVYGGADRRTQIQQLERGADILIATPGRLNDLLNSNYIDLSRLSFLVLDEADRLLDMGFEPQIREIMGHLQNNHARQTMMWSATWEASVQGLANTIFGSAPYMVKVGSAGQSMQVNENITQHVYVCEDDNERIGKIGELYKSQTINARAKGIFFVQKKDTCEEVAGFISHNLSRTAGVNPRSIQPIHGGMTQQKRDWTLESFRRNPAGILVATDVVGRGLDFPDVATVVNFDPPAGIDQYVHRIGRTGRAGRKGTSHTLLVRRELKGDFGQDLVKYLSKANQHVPDALRAAADEAARRFGGGRFGGRGGFRRGGGGFRGGGGGYGRGMQRGGGGGGYRGDGGAGRGGGGGRFGDSHGGGRPQHSTTVFDDDGDSF